MKETKKKQHEIVMPMRYEITAGRTHFLEDGTPIWVLNYTEFHDEEDYNRAKPDSIETFNKLGMNMKFNDKDFSVSYDIQGPRDMITNIMTSEFMGRSQIASMSILDLIAVIIRQAAELGRTPSWTEIKEEKDQPPIEGDLYSSCPQCGSMETEQYAKSAAGTKYLCLKCENTFIPKLLRTLDLENEKKET